MRVLLLLLALFLAALAGCTDDGGDGGPDDGIDGSDGGDGGNQTVPQNVSLEIAATGLYPVTHAFDKDTLSAPAGAMVTLTFTNNDQNVGVQHDWVASGIEGAATAMITPGNSDTITFQAPMEPGEYTYICSVGNHAEQMSGTLTITAAEGADGNATL